MLHVARIVLLSAVVATAGSASAQEADLEVLRSAFAYPKSEIVECSEAEKAVEVPAAITQYFRLVCTAYGQVLVPQPDWAWLDLEKNSPVFLPAAPDRSADNAGLAFANLSAERREVTASFPIDFGLPPEIATVETFSKAFSSALVNKTGVIVVTLGYRDAAREPYRFAIFDVPEPIAFGHVTALQGSAARTALLNIPEMVEHGKKK